MNSVVSTELIYCACGCGQQRPRFNKQGIERRFIKYHSHLKGKNHWNYGDGTKINDKGYRLVKKPDHPHANSSGYVYEHRLVYEEYHRCCLLRYADIHHINGNRLDNRIENLQPLSHSQHLSVTFKKDMSDRTCSECGNSTTYKVKDSPAWYKKADGFICGKCYHRAIKRRKVLPT